LIFELISERAGSHVGIGTKLTLEEFLALPDPDVYCEFVDGEAVPKVSPKYFHSTLQFTLSRQICVWCKGRRRVLPEGGILLKHLGKDLAPLPDETYIYYERLPKFGGGMKLVLQFLNG
jgi:Uma2 family endonuclease